MRKLTIGIGFALALLGVAPLAQAQLLEGLVWAAASSLVNNALARGQQKTVSAVKVMCDILTEDVDGKFSPTPFGWDPTTQTSIFMVDGLALRVAAFTNGPPPHGLTYYLNEAKIAFRKVEGDRGGKDGKGLGVIGDYPVIKPSQMRYGINQIKVYAGGKQWGDCTFWRLRSVKDVLAGMGDPELREKLYGFGGATYPSMPTLVTQMPDGSLATFHSKEEMEATFAKLNKRGTQGGGSTPPQGGKIDPPQPPAAGQTVDVATTASPFTVQTHLYDLAETRVGDGNAIRMDLATKASQSELLSGDVLLIPSVKGQAVLVRADTAFTAELVDPDGKTIRKYVVAPFEFRGVTHYSTIVLLSNDGKPMSNRLVLRSGNERRVITFGGGK